MISRTIQSFKRFTLAASLPIVAFLIPAGAGVGATAGCGDSDSCISIRATTYSNLKIWEACDPADPNACSILEPGNAQDCSGVLTCPFAINPKYRAVAEQALLDIAEQTRGCYACATPSCPSGLPSCEPVSKRCILNGAPVSSSGSGSGGTSSGASSGTAGADSGP